MLTADLLLDLSAGRIQSWRCRHELPIMRISSSDTSRGLTGYGVDGVGAQANCFELLGFDVMIDRQLKPWLIEVNSSLP